jgi:hypothetical protein
MALMHNVTDRYWRTDIRRGRNVYACISNDPTQPSEDDPLVGTMETSEIAEDVVNTHNGALAQFGKRYRTVLSDVDSGRADAGEVFFVLGREEKQGLMAITDWLRGGLMRLLVEEGPTRSALDKLYRALGGF